MSNRMKGFGGLLGCVALSVMAMFALRARADTNTRWISAPVDSAWENAANWDNGVP
jgi:hypothetical protein